MTMFPPPNPPPDFVSTLPDQPRAGENSAQSKTASLIIRICCWTIILGLSALEVLNNAHRSETPVATTQQSADVAAPAVNPAIAIAGRYAVGVHTWKLSGQADTIKSLVDQVSSVAKTSAEQLDVAIVSREVESPGDADQRLAKVTASSKLSVSDHDDIETLEQINRDGPLTISASQRASLVARHGWFGRLALTHGLPDDNPERHALLQATRRTLIVMGVGTGLGIAVLLIGVALMVLAIVLGATQRLLLRYRRAINPGTAYLEGFVIYMVGFLIVSFALRATLKEPSIAWTFAATILLPIVLVWPVIRGESWSAVREHFGWTTGEGVLTEMAAGITTYLAFIPLLGGSLLLTGVLIKIAEHFNTVGASPTHPIINFLTGSPGTLVLVYLLASVWAPIMEETMFRGALFHHLRGRHGWWISSIVVSLIFAAIHPQGWTVIPPLAALAMMFCAMREWRGSLIASMTAHAINNGVVITLSVLLLR